MAPTSGANSDAVVAASPKPISCSIGRKGSNKCKLIASPTVKFNRSVLEQGTSYASLGRSLTLAHNVVCEVL